MGNRKPELTLALGGACIAEGEAKYETLTRLPHGEGGAGRLPMLSESR